MHCRNRPREPRRSVGQPRHNCGLRTARAAPEQIAAICEGGFDAVPKTAAAAAAAGAAGERGMTPPLAAPELGAGGFGAGM